MEARDPRAFGPSKNRFNPSSSSTSASVFAMEKSDQKEGLVGLAGGRVTGGRTSFKRQSGAFVRISTRAYRPVRAEGGGRG